MPGEQTTDFFQNLDVASGLACLSVSNCSRALTVEPVADLSSGATFGLDGTTAAAGFVRRATVTAALVTLGVSQTLAFWGVPSASMSTDIVRSNGLSAIPAAGSIEASSDTFGLMPRREDDVDPSASPSSS
jgi:hypothetical protein